MGKVLAVWVGGCLAQIYPPNTPMSLTGTFRKESQGQGVSGKSMLSFSSSLDEREQNQKMSKWITIDIFILEVASPPKFPCLSLVHLDERIKDRDFLA